MLCVLKMFEMGGTHGQIELSVADIIASIGNLNNHPLACRSSILEGKFVTLAALRVLRSDGSKPIGKVVVDCPRGLIRAHEGVAALTTRPGIGVGQRLVLDVAGLDGAGNPGFV